MPREQCIGIMPRECTSKYVSPDQCILLMHFDIHSLDINTSWGYVSHTLAMHIYWELEISRHILRMHLDNAEA